jgi:arsenate reductase
MDACKVLFVCQHNSARSQMAEALLKHLAGDRFLVESAGFETAAVNPLAIEVMAEMGIDISRNRSKNVFDFFKEGRMFNWVVTVCDEAQAEACPVFPGITKRMRWSFEDPSRFTGSHEEKIAQTRAVRDAIKARLEVWMNTAAC